MNTRDAAYMTGHSYPGGVPALAARMGMDARALSLKLNPNDAAHTLSLDEAVVLMALTGDHRILNAMASELGYVLAQQQPGAPKKTQGTPQHFPLRGIQSTIIRQVVTSKTRSTRKVTQ